MIYLTGLKRRPGVSPPPVFPWTLRLIRELDALELTAPVTLFVGENGSGKSTLLEGLAAGYAAETLDRMPIGDNETLQAAQRLREGFFFLRRRHARHRMFFRAEDTFSFTQDLKQSMAGLSEIEEELRAALPEGSVGQMRATGLARGQRMALEQSYGADPDGRSHGELFLTLLEMKLKPNGLYFLDEPEGPLSPTRVLALIALLRDRVETGDCQFIIATHSPILMAYPGAQILGFEDGRIAPVEFQDVEHVRVTKAFLNDPDNFLRRL